MNIAEAAKKALETNGFICRQDECKFIRIKPTTSPDCCVVYSNGGERSAVRWNPDVLDLIADDWQVIDNLENMERI